MRDGRSAIRAAFGALLLAAVAVPLCGASRDQRRFSTSVEAVRVDVLVSDRGRPVPGLTSADFEVRDNGVLQDATLIAFERVPINLVMVFDFSVSVAGERLRHLQRAGRAMIDRLEAGDRAALVGFNHLVTLQSELTGDRARLFALLDAAAPSGSSALVDATYAGMMVAEPGAERTLVLVLSDGLDVASFLPESRIVDAARRLDVVIYGVTMSGEGPPFLERITSETGGRLLRVEARNLSDTFVRVLAEFRQRYVLSYTPRGVAGPGWHQLDVRVKKRRVTVKARPGYFAAR